MNMAQVEFEYKGLSAPDPNRSTSQLTLSLAVAKPPASWATLPSVLLARPQLIKTATVVKASFDPRDDRPVSGVSKADRYGFWFGR